MKTLKTTYELIEYLKLFPHDTEVFYDTNPLTGGKFEHLVIHPENDSPLDMPKTIAFLSYKGW